jgi:hypothetical protein
MAAALALSSVLLACDRDAEPEAGVNTDTVGDTLDTFRSPFRVTEVELGTGMVGDTALQNETDDFQPGDTVHALVKHEGRSDGTRILARWTFQDGQIVDERTETISSSADGAEYTHFTISKPDGLPAGRYTLHVLVNDQEVETEEFEVGAQ